MIAPASTTESDRPPASGWFWIDNKVLDMLSTIGPTAFIVYAILARHANVNRKCHPGLTTIARMAGMKTKKPVLQALKVLARNRFIAINRKRSKTGVHSHNEYTLLPIDTGDSTAGGSVPEDTTPPGLVVSPGIPGSVLGDTRGSVPQDTRTRLIQQDPLNKKEDCNEAASRPSLPATIDQHVFPVFVCAVGRRNGATTWLLTSEQIAEWREAFPAVDVPVEARQAHVWVKANWARRKTSDGMAEFLRRWLARAQNSGGRTNGAHSQDSQARVRSGHKRQIRVLTNGNGAHS